MSLEPQEQPLTLSWSSDGRPPSPVDDWAQRGGVDSMQHLISRGPQATGSKMPSYTLPPESSQPGCGLLPGGILAVTLFCFLKSKCPALPTSWPERGPALSPGEDRVSHLSSFVFSASVHWLADAIQPGHLPAGLILWLPSRFLSPARGPFHLGHTSAQQD